MMKYANQTLQSGRLVTAAGVVVEVAAQMRQASVRQKLQSDEALMATHQTQAELAYHLWEARGRPSGSTEVDWLEAGRQIYGLDAVDGQHEMPLAGEADSLAVPEAATVGPTAENPVKPSD